MRNCAPPPVIANRTASSLSFSRRLMIDSELQSTDESTLLWPCIMSLRSAVVHKLQFITSKILALLYSSSFSDWTLLTKLEHSSLVPGVNCILEEILKSYWKPWAARCSVVGWSAMLQTGRSRVRLPMRLLDISVTLILPAALWPWESTQPLTEMNTRNLPGE
jgi:hypothetical protein